MVNATDVAIIHEIATNTQILGQGWLIPLIIVFLTIIIVTRSPQKWAILLLPTYLAWMASGIKIPGGWGIVIIAIAILFYILSIFTTQEIGNVIGTIGKTTNTVRTVKALQPKQRKEYIQEQLGYKTTKQLLKDVKLEKEKKKGITPQFKQQKKLTEKTNRQLINTQSDITQFKTWHMKHPEIAEDVGIDEWDKYFRKKKIKKPEPTTKLKGPN